MERSSRSSGLQLSAEEQYRAVVLLNQLDPSDRTNKAVALRALLAEGAMPNATNAEGWQAVCSVLFPVDEQIPHC